MFHVVLLNDLHLARKPRPLSSFARPTMPFVNQERLVLSSLLSANEAITSICYISFF